MGEDKTIVITVRVIDRANPLAGTWTIPCGDCGELTWISGIWKNKKIDKVVCFPCYSKNYKDGDYVACTNEETIQQVLEVLRGRGINVTKEEILEKLGIKIGREIKMQ
jgi:selenophosphate synthetase-related protein